MNLGTEKKTREMRQEYVRPVEASQVPEQKSEDEKAQIAPAPVFEAVSPRTKASIEEWTANCSEEERFRVFEYMLNNKREEFQRCGVFPPKIDVNSLFQRVSFYFWIGYVLLRRNDLRLRGNHPRNGIAY